MDITKVIFKSREFISNADYRFLWLSEQGLFDHWDDDRYLSRKFKAAIGQKLNLKDPKTMNEKLQWLKLYDHRPEYTVMVDKYAVRQYIAKKLGGEYLIPILGVWTSPEEINFEDLPNQFVLKCNHNSGLGMYICKDKSKMNLKKVKADLKKGLKQNYFLTGREWPYKNVARKIIAEKYMVDSKSEELVDYKIHNFNGIPKVILVCSQRFSKGGLREDFYNTKWEKLNLRRPDHPTSVKEIEKPQNLEKMLLFSEKLSKGYPFMRTDFYEINGKLYFGEITLYPASGFSKFSPEKWDYKMGNWITLPKK